MAHYPRGQMAAKKLLGENAEYVVVTDRYAGYHYIEQEKRQLCWAHILRNVSAIAQSWGSNLAIGKRLETIVNMLFSTGIVLKRVILLRLSSAASAAITNCVARKPGRGKSPMYHT